ncbi:hypothetical protein [Burkholderia pseudomallei]|uniref:hypothetical protein n=2 Tax=Burkholderia pseudomallei TaxID=28450 RepID=UPI001F3A8D1E|nr:hypothetical protein [Burkholderia pseudomallei]
MNEERETARAASCVPIAVMAAMRAVPRRRGREIARMQRRRACARVRRMRAARRNGGEPRRGRRPTAATACALAGVDARRAVRIEHIEHIERGDRRAIRLIAGSPDVAAHTVTLY